MRFQNLSRHPDIGSNSYLVEAGGVRLVLDAGSHPKHTGADTLPLYEKLAPGSVDAILMSHPHLDHIGALPVLMRQHPEAPAIMTHLTRDYGSALLHNSVNVMKAQREELDEPSYPLYTHREIDELSARWLARETGQPFSLGDRGRATCEFFGAGHVIGAVGVRIEAEGHVLFYTGDVHFEDQTLAPAARFPEERLDALVMETTRGDHARDPGYTREGEKRRFGEAIAAALARGGAVLIPVFAFGKTQEVLLMLNELMEEDIVPPVPVHIGGLSTKMTQITDRHSNDPGRRHRGFKILEDFPEVNPLPRGRREPDFEPGRIYALSSGMMSEHTVSHRFARRVLASPQHALFFVGYADEETPGGRILEAGTGGRVALSSDSDHESEIRCEVRRFDFSGHATREQLRDFAVARDPRTVVLVHGDEPARAWFAAELARLLPRTRVVIPKPGESIDLA
jgi:Cft2 family RNA processing exonuclease